jgi:hypothetical protein
MSNYCHITSVQRSKCNIGGPTQDIAMRENTGASTHFLSSNPGISTHPGGRHAAWWHAHLRVHWSHTGGSGRSTRRGSRHARPRLVVRARLLRVLYRVHLLVGREHSGHGLSRRACRATARHDRARPHGSWRLRRVLLLQLCTANLSPLRNGHVHGFAVQHGGIHYCDCASCLLRGREAHKPKALGLAGGVLHDLRQQDPWMSAPGAPNA